MNPGRRGAQRAAGATASAAVALALTMGWVAGCSGFPGSVEPHVHKQGPPAGAGAVAAFQREMNASMARMMHDMHASGYAGDADIDFLAMMIPHHAGAVDMARLVLQHGHDPATRQLAEEIIAGQTIEIESMSRRLAQLRRSAAANAAAEFPALGGTRGP